MTGLGFQLLLPVIAIRWALAHHEIVDVIEVVRILGGAYRLASSGTGWGVAYGRFALEFCGVVVAGMRSKGYPATGREWPGLRPLVIFVK